MLASGYPAPCCVIHASVGLLQYLDAPTALVEDRGWTVTVTDMAVPGQKWKRWAQLPVPADVPNVPRGYFVEAVKA
jgi:hypothetical protein